MRQLQWIGLAMVLALTAIVYSEHFHGAFHIDDIHTIVNNAYIRDLSHVPQFFTDGTTSSSQPGNQTYRPILTTTLAIDYQLGGGTADTLAFHITSFAVFLCLGLCLFLLTRAVYSRADERHAGIVAAFATGWFMLHPVSAEAVCYIVQRGDVLAAFFVVPGMVLYISSPLSRKYGLYVIPVLLGILSKPIAVVFPLLLLAYILLFERKKAGAAGAFPWSQIVIAMVAAIAAGLLVNAMTSHSYQPGGGDAWLYRFTQPYVLGFYFVEWFAPLWLAADHGWQVFESPFAVQALVGYLFIVAMAAAIFFAARRERTRPIAFGLAWYLIANLTTSWIALNEVATDHRMFFPNIGLAIAVSWAIYLLVDTLGHRFKAVKVVHYVAGGICAIGLLGYAYGAYERTLVWQTEESLWADAVAKEPQSERAHLDYGLALLRRKALPEAETQFAEILRLRPDYAIANLDMGIVKHEQGKDAESGQYLKHAVESGRESCPPCYYYYAMYLNQQGQVDEAINILYKAYELSSANVEGRELLMELLYKQHRAEELRKVTAAVLTISPGDSRASYYQRLLSSAPAATAVPATAESYIDRSGQAYRDGRYQDCIDNAQKALELKPDFAEGYNNLAAANNKLGRYDEAKQAALQALKLDPQSRFAQINLAAAERGLATGQK